KMESTGCLKSHPPQRSVPSKSKQHVERSPNVTVATVTFSGIENRPTQFEHRRSPRSSSRSQSRRRGAAQADPRPALLQSETENAKRLHSRCEQSVSRSLSWRSH